MLNSTSISDRRATLVVILATTLFVLFFGISNWFRHVNLYTSMFDMGNMDQVLWHSLHGQFFQMTSPDLAILQPRTAIHADFLLLAYLPFYAVWPDPRVPLVLQVLVVASGVIPIFWLARKKLGPSIGAFISVLFLLYPTLEWAVTFDVHAVVLATPIFLWAWWAANEKRWWVYYLMIGLAILTKEEVGLVVAAMGIFWGWRRGYRTMGLISLVLGLSWSLAMLTLAIPHARNNPGHFALGYYSDFGGSYSDIVKNILLHPIKTLVTVFDADGWSMLRGLLYPVGAVALLGFPILLIALPELGVNLLSNNPNLQQIYFQYMSVITPFVFLATIDGWDRARRWIKVQHFHWPVEKIEWWGTAGVAALAMVAIIKWSPLPGTFHQANALRVFHPSPYKKDVEFVQRSLLPADRVATTNNLGPQFSQRDLIWGFPNHLEKADAIVVLEGGYFDFLPPDQITAAADELTRNPEFTLVYHRDTFWYFRRTISS